MDDRDGWAGLLAAASTERSAQPGAICRLCASMLGVTGAGISMVTTSGNRGVICSTDAIAARIEDLQFTLGEGPCVDAVHSGTPVLVPDLQAPEDIDTARWPAFLEEAEAAGVRAVFAFPLRIGAISLGALDLYRDEPGELGPEELPAALMAADAAAHALLHMELGSEGGLSDGWGGALGYPLQVHQATGMVQVQLSVSVEEALLRLRARAFALGRPLLDVANDIVERRLRFSLEDG